METTQKLQSLNNEINAQVDASLGSLFTKDDVKNVINGLFEKVYDILNEEEGVPTQTNLDDVFDSIRNSLDELEPRHYISIHDEEFCISYNNQIELNDYSIDFNATRFGNAIVGYVRDRVQLTL
jgi:hypothetical protein